MSIHAKAAEANAKRAGAYLSTAENLDIDPHTREIAAQNAQTSATLAVAQRIAQACDVIENGLGEIRAELNRDDSPADQSLRLAIQDVADRLSR
jgi:hypothetical protein